jgi:hypothetical protein
MLRITPFDRELETYGTFRVVMQYNKPRQTKQGLTSSVPISKRAYKQGLTSSVPISKRDYKQGLTSSVPISKRD